MKILLVGEYSGLHNSLKEGLEKLGHQVKIVGAHDGFKNYPVDIKIDHSFRIKIAAKFKVAFYKITSLDLGALEIFIKLHLKNNQLKGYDVVQLINELPFKTTPWLESIIINRMIKNNKKLFLLSSGVDYQSMRFMMNKSIRYSVMSPYLKDKTLKPHYKFQLRYLQPNFKKLNDFIYQNSNGVIATDMDYHLPLIGNSAYLGMIPNPINIDRVPYITLHTKHKIRIFHGINNSATFRKGNPFFTEALDIIRDRYPEQVEIISTTNLPYDEYIKVYDDCHILLDQIYSFDQGYNALEAMAKGKVVFTGAEKEWQEYYQIAADTVVINALPNVDYLVSKMSWLIENPEKILEISKNARAFIEREHNYINIAEKYVNTWHIKSK